MSRYLNTNVSSTNGNINISINDNSYTYNLSVMGKDYNLYCLEVDYPNILNVITCVNVFGKKWWVEFYNNYYYSSNIRFMPENLTSYINSNIDQWERTRKIETALEV